jgi:uncharacterized protein (TIGR01244 family)
MHVDRVWMLVAALVGASCGASTPTPPARQPVATVTTPPATTAIIPIPNAAQPLPDVLTGGQPTEDNLQSAKQAGYHTVISLLPDAQSADEAQQARALGLQFVSIPVAGADDLTVDNAHRLADAMNAPDAKPLILHCASGNRVGALLALKAFHIDGLSRDRALELGTQAGLASLKPAVEAKLVVQPAQAQ